MTQEQVARHARVSPSTVSRVLNNTCAVSSGVRARVVKAVEELRYSPNLDARGLAGGMNGGNGNMVESMLRGLIGRKKCGELATGRKTATYTVHNEDMSP